MRYLIPAAKFVGTALGLICLAWLAYQGCAYSREKYQRKYPNATTLDWLSDLNK